MQKTLKIICRDSKLARIQGQMAQKMIEKNDPSVKIEILTKPSRGDLDTTMPLYLMGDKNIFTQDLEAALTAEQADLTVHSLKDLSADKFDDPRFKLAVFDRDLPHDVVIFRPNFDKILRGGKSLILGTSSLRRETLTPPFLEKHVLQNIDNQKFSIEVKPIRGNADTRLRKLRAGDFDAIALAAAGLNRLLADEPSVSELLADCRVVLLPLMECPPAAGQGALVVECLATNAAACAVLEKINDVNLAHSMRNERQTAKKYGAGCHQRFGVVSFDTRGGNLIRVAGKITSDLGNAKIQNTEGGILDDLRCDIPLSAFDFTKKALFSATDFMRDFFNYDFKKLNDNDLEKIKNAKTVFVAHHRAVENSAVLAVLKTKQIWVSGTKTWRELAKLGLEVQGCADGLGFHFLNPVFESPLFTIKKQDILILTNINAAVHWQAEGIAAIGTYGLITNDLAHLKSQFATAELCFWTNFEQYAAAKPYLKTTVVHACPSGKTANLFLEQGIQPIIFPTIKAFLHWRMQF
jgi:hydroxymethylbilane synthase